jgi:flagellar export protein FliJ
MSRKAKDLDSLIRLNSWTVDERQRELGVFLACEMDLIARGQQMDQQLLDEQGVASRDPTSAGFMYAAFANDHLRRKEELRQQLHHVRLEIEAARDRLAGAYRQLKVYEEVRKGRALKETAEEARREQQDLDEIGLNLHRRKTASNGEEH